MSVSGFRPFSRQAKWCPKWSVCCLVSLCALAASQTSFGQVIPTSRSNSTRFYAKDALFEIPPGMEYGETFQGPIDLPLVVQNPDIAWQPNYSAPSDTLAEMGREVVFRGDVYCLDFAFLTVRVIEIQGKPVWYMLYRIRYLGGDLRPTAEPDAYNNQVYATPEKLSADSVSELPTRFSPLFRLHVNNLRKEYLDQVIPGAKAMIAAKERIEGPLYDSIEIQKVPVKLWRDTDQVDNSLWGVATWTNVDPSIDFFSVHVQGLTNAQRLKQDGDKIKYLQKNLVLNFSRPGDTVNELEDRIRFGIPTLDNSLPEVSSAIANEAKELGVKTRNMKANYAAATVLRSSIDQLQRSELIAALNPPVVDEFQTAEEQQKILATNRLNNQAVLSQVKSLIEKNFAAAPATGSPAYWSSAINGMLSREAPESGLALLDVLREVEHGLGASIPRQKYVLLQFGLEERLDHLWIYR